MNHVFHDPSTGIIGRMQVVPECVEPLSDAAGQRLCRVSG